MTRAVGLTNRRAEWVHKSTYMLAQEVWAFKWKQLAWPCHPISLSFTFGLHRRMGLGSLPFKPIYSSSNSASPITEESHRSRPSHYSPSLCRSRFSALIDCQSAVLSSATRRAHQTQIRYKCKTRHSWSDMNQDSVPALSVSASNVFRNNFSVCLAEFCDRLWWGSHVGPS